MYIIYYIICIIYIYVHLDRSIYICHQPEASSITKASKTIIFSEKKRDCFVKYKKFFSVSQTALFFLDSSMHHRQKK